MFSVAVLLVSVGILLWANLVLAGDVAAWLGEPRWHGVAAAAGGAAVLTAWRGARRIVPLLLVVAALALAWPLGELAHVTGLNPVAAWSRVATLSTFRFPPGSPWVTVGRDFALIGGRGPILFEEEHRLTAPLGGRLSALTQDGGHSTEVEWTLAPGQSVTLRAGDSLRPGSAGRLRFEPDKRVPGSPSSGVAWASARRGGWAERAGLLLTLLFGGLAVCRMGFAAPVTRSMAGLVALGGFAVLLWAQGWAMYCLLASPDLFLGGAGAERLLVFPAPGPSEEWRQALQVSLLAGSMAGFLASTIALRERLGALDRTGGGEIGHDLGLWIGVFAIAGVASLWPRDGWSLVLLALGAAASGVGAAALGSGARASSGARTFAGCVGLAVFIGLAAAGHLRPASDGVLSAVLAYPALAAVPIGAAVLRLTHRLADR